MTAAPTTRAPLPWWSSPLWWLLAVAMVGLFVLGETMVAYVLTYVVFDGEIVESFDRSTPADGNGFGIVLMVFSAIVVVDRRRAARRVGRARGGIALGVLFGVSAIAAVAWATAGVMLLTSRWPGLWSSPSGLPVGPLAWPAAVGVLVYVGVAVAHAVFARFALRTIRDRGVTTED